MNYELALKLKEAGFPQFDDDREGGRIFPPGTMLDDDDFEEKAAYLPTLSELIEACKGRIIKLWILADGRAGVQLEMQSLDDVIYYATPEEAVARLWLALKK